MSSRYARIFAGLLPRNRQQLPGFQIVRPRVRPPQRKTQAADVSCRHRSHPRPRSWRQKRHFPIKSIPLHRSLISHVCGCPPPCWNPMNRSASPTSSRSPNGNSCKKTLSVPSTDKPQPTRTTGRSGYAHSKKMTICSAPNSGGTPSTRNNSRLTVRDWHRGNPERATFSRT